MGFTFGQRLKLVFFGCIRIVHCVFSLRLHLPIHYRSIGSKTPFSPTDPHLSTYLWLGGIEKPFDYSESRNTDRKEITP